MKEKLSIEEEERIWSKYLVKCDRCGKTFLPWHSLCLNDESTGWKTFCHCECGNWFSRDENMVDKNTYV